MSTDLKTRSRNQNLTPYFSDRRDWPLVPLQEREGSSANLGMTPAHLNTRYGKDHFDSYLDKILSETEAHQLIESGFGVGLKCGEGVLAVEIKLWEVSDALMGQSVDVLVGTIRGNLIREFGLDINESVRLASSNGWYLQFLFRYPSDRSLDSDYAFMKGVSIKNSKHVPIAGLRFDKACPAAEFVDQTINPFLMLAADLPDETLTRLDKNERRAARNLKLKSASSSQIIRLLDLISIVDLEKQDMEYTEDEQHLVVLVKSIKACRGSKGFALYDQWQSRIPRRDPHYISKDEYDAFEVSGPKYNIATIAALAMDGSGTEAFETCEEIFDKLELTKEFQSWKRQPIRFQKIVGLNDLDISWSANNPKKLETWLYAANQEFGHYLDPDGRSKIIVKAYHGEEPRFIPEKELHRRPGSKVLSNSGDTDISSREWIAHEDHAYYESVRFHPGQKTETGCYNLFTGWSAASNDSAPCSSFLSFVKEELCGNDSELNDYVLSYCAHLIQRPDEKPSAAIVFHDIDPEAKSVFFSTLRSLIGERYFVSHSNLNSMFERFNKELETALVVNISEAALSNREAEASRLGSMITDKSVQIREHYKPARTRSVFFRMIIDAPRDWAPRRSKSADQYVHILPKQHPLGLKLRQAAMDELEQHSASGLMHFLKTRDLSDFQVNQTPRSDFQTENKILRLRNLERFWYDILFSGELLPHTSDQWQEGSLKVKKSIFLNQYNHHAHSAQSQRNPLYKPITAELFTKELKKICPGLQSTRTRISGHQTPMYIIPNLQTCRSEFERALGLEPDWDDIL